MSAFDSVTTLKISLSDSSSGRAIKKWVKTLDYVSCFLLHFVRVLPLPAFFTTEQSTVEACLFVNYKTQSTLFFHSIRWKW